MSNYCYDCTKDILGVDPKRNDFGSFEAIGPRIPEGEFWKVLCEGCGVIVVDNEGKKVNETRLSFFERIDEDEDEFWGNNDE